MVNGNKPGFFTQVLFFIAAVISTAVFLLVGATAFLVVLGLAIILFVVVGIRMWWLRRKFIRQYGDANGNPPDIATLLAMMQQQQSNASRSGHNHPSDNGRVVEGEIVSDDEEPNR